MNGEPGYWLPSGRSSVTLPPSGPPVCSDIVRGQKSHPTLPPVFRHLPSSTRLA